MVHTAIIAFGLIFLMFFLKECGNKETTENIDTKKEIEIKEVEEKEGKEIKISKDEKVLTLIKPEITLENTKVPITEVELILNDKEKHQVVMDVVSQIELENQSIRKTEKIALKAELIKEIRPELKIELLALKKAEAERLAQAKTEAEKLVPAKEIEVATVTTNETEKKTETKIASETSTEIIEDTKLAVVEKVSVPSETIEVEKKISEPKIAKVAEVSAPSKTVEIEEKIEIATLMSQPKIATTATAVEPEENKALQKENGQLQEKITKLLEIAKKATTKAQIEHDARSTKIENLVAEHEALKTDLKEELTSGKLLQRENSQLETKIVKLLAIAERATTKAQAEHDAESKNLQTLIAQKNDLESNLTLGNSNEKLLKEENENLKDKITKLLEIAKKATVQAEAEQVVESKEIETLKIDLTTGLKENSELKDKITKLLEIAKKATVQAEAEQVVESKEIQTLKIDLTAGLAENEELKGKITKLLTIAQKATTTAQAEDNATKQEIISLKADLENELEANSQLKEKITKLLDIAQRATSQAQIEDDITSKEMQGIITQNSNLRLLVKDATSTAKEANKEIQFSKDLEAKKVQTLLAEQDGLNLKIITLLSIAEKATATATAEHDEELKEMQGLLSKQKDLESNLTAGSENQELLKEENNNLKSKIAELLSIAEKATSTAIAEHDEELKEMQGLLSKQKDLESNLTAGSENQELLKEENNNLKGKIAELLSIAEKATATAIAEHDEEVKEMQGLLSKQKDLESNLTAGSENQELLKEENDNLKGKIAELLSIAEKATSTAIAEHDEELKEMQGLLSQHKELKDNSKKEVFDLNAQIAELLLIAQRATEVATAEHDEDVKEMQGLLSQTKNLESNLTAGLENEKLLQEENGNLKGKIAELLSVVENDKSLEENLTQTLEATQAKLETLEAEKVAAAQKAEEERLAKEKEEAEAAAAAQKAEEERLAKEKEEAEAAATAQKAEEERLAKEKEEAEAAAAAQKAEEERLAKEKEEAEAAAAAQKAEEERLAKEKKEAEATAAAQKAEEERLAKEKEEAEAAAAAQKAEEERLAKEKEEAEAAAAAQKAEEERLAKEKEEAEKAAAAAQKAEEERLAKEKEEAEKAAAAAAIIAATKATEKTILDTFALTKVEFKYNSMQLTTKSRNLLDNAASVMKEHANYHYNIQGHTDDRGKDEYNLKLSAKRAEKVKEYLVSKGVDNTILTTEGLGSLQPIASNDTKAGRLINRRVVFEIVK